MNAINLSILEELREALGEDFDELLSTYIDSTAELLTDLAVARQQTQLDEIQRLSHSLKSSSASVGATTLSQLARGIEEQTREGSVNALEQRIESLKAEFERVRIALLEIGEAGNTNTALRQRTASNT